jgi:predicted glycoside hydrolase/deacetylase ChbG (UPF0249 family)
MEDIMKVIVNADDYGWNINSIEATRKCFSEGVVTNTTAMVTMPCFEEALELAKKDGFADRIGLHVNLSAGTPLTDGIRRSLIFCDKDGNFSGQIRKSKLYRFWLSSAVKKMIADEIRAQMKLFLRFGLTQRHYDSHGQVCVYWPILPIALQCAKEFGFRSTRMFINMSANPHCYKLSLLRRGYIRHIDNCILKSGFGKTDYLGSSWDLPRMMDELPKDSVIELMVHPQYRLPDFTMDMSGELMDWKTSYEQSFAPILRNRGSFNMISFNELLRG